MASQSTAPSIQSSTPATPQSAIVTPTAQSTADLMKQTSREYILIAGKDGVGKSCAIVSLAKWVQTINPTATFYVIDTENKFPTALRSFGTEAPTNIVYYKCETIGQVLAAFNEIMMKRKAWDWLAVESMARIWERAQSMGYKAISGYDKAEYLEIRRTKIKSAPVIPSPDRFWDIVKGAHDDDFIDIITNAGSLNVILSTTLSRPPEAGSFIKENETRKTIRAEFGLDAGMSGAPRLPTYVETTCLLDLVGGNVQCRIVRDNLSALSNPKQTFDVPDRTLWGMLFYSTCRS